VTVREWLHDRTPAPPSRLAARIDAVLGERGEAEHHRLSPLCLETAQELLTTFQDEIGEVALIPGTGGVFEVRVDGQTIWSRKGEGRHAELAELKQRLRDVIAPERALGHSDRKAEE